MVPRSLCHIRAPRNICAASSCLRCNSCALCHARYNRNWANRMTATTAAPSSLSLRRLMTQVHRNSSDSCGARPEPRCHIGTSVHAALLPRVASGVGFRPWCWRVRPLMPWHALEHAQGIDLVTDCFFFSHDKCNTFSRWCRAKGAACSVGSGADGQWASARILSLASQV